jgi:heterodisulfide reductase subunit C
MDITPRHMWRMVLMDWTQDIFKSKSFIMCSSCYYCTLRCPRGLELTQAMNLLKQAASKAELVAFRRSTVFYRSFLDNVRKYGRVKEMQFMTRYFISMKNPVIPLQFAPLGLKLMARKKIHTDFSPQGRGKLNALFEKTAQLEE